MANFYSDNNDIQFLFRHVDLGTPAEICEEGFRFAGEFDHAPADAEEAIQNYEMVLDSLGELCAEFIAPRAEDVDREGNVLETAKEGIPRTVIARGRFDSRHFVDSNLPYSSVARKHGTEVLGVEASFTEPDRHQIRVIVATPEQRGHWAQGDADRWELYSIPGRERAAKALNTALRKAMKMIDSKLKQKRMQYLDPGFNEADRRKVAEVISAAREKHMMPALRKYSKWGASDSEGYYHAKYALVDYVKRKTGWWDVGFEDYI